MDPEDFGNSEYRLPAGQGYGGISLADANICVQPDLE